MLAKRTIFFYKWHKQGCNKTAGQSCKASF